MKYNKDDIQTVLDLAQCIVGVLRAAGYDAHIVGGALRVLAVGGSTSDVDIAVLTTVKESQLLHKDTQILFKFAGLNFHLQHCMAYAGACGFIADWRSGDINIISYDKETYPTVESLVQGFDYNFNMYLLNSDSTLRNVSLQGNDRVYLNTNIASHHNIDRVMNERTPRFKEMLGHLDWSACL